MKWVVDANIFIAAWQPYIYLALATQTKSQLITLDTEILMRGAQIVEVLTPDEWLSKFRR